MSKNKLFPCPDSLWRHNNLSPFLLP